jgi:hypothetical protein
MFDMFKNTVVLFFRGRLYRDYRLVLRQWLLCFAVTLAVLLVLGFVVTPVVGVVVASLVGGAMQPYMFKDLKYD